jgi:hypothetical protein
MAGSDLSIRIDIDQVSRVFAVAPQLAQARMRLLIDASAVDVQRELRIAAPVGSSGNLRRAIRYTYNPSSISAEITPEAPYTDAVEFGSRPHWTSARPGTSLAKWANMKGINPYAVQRSIATKGTKAHPFVRPTYNKMRPRVERDINAGINRFVEEVNNGQV